MQPGSILVLAVILISSTLVAGDRAKGEKKGVCPVDNVRCIRPESPKCHSDRDCEGLKKCCYLHCGFKCVQPVKTIEESE
uniref:WAP four-disulfide core domain 12 n=1 Tax=Cricetulus griseus TaxID=10029 RepID=A0A3L7HD47_CRIGR